jgi:branched-chain amino acid transport system permease protein
MKKILPIIFILFAVFIPLIFKTRPSLVYFINLSLIYAIAAQGLNLLMGIGGQISLGHAAFMAIGGYTSAILVMKFHTPFLLALVAGIAISCIFGLIVGFPSLRLKGFYLAIATMALGSVVTDVIRRLEITGGDYGFANISPPQIFKFVFSSNFSQFYLILGLFLLATWITRNFIRSKSGMALQAMRDSETGAVSLGVNIANYKLLAFIVSSAFAGLAGVLYAHLVTYLNPGNFGLGFSIDLLAITIIGGLGTLWGSLFGAILWVLVRNFLSTAHLEVYAGIFFGIILILIILFMPRGLSEIIFRVNKLLNRKKVAT